MVSKSNPKPLMSLLLVEGDGASHHNTRKLPDVALYSAINGRAEFLKKMTDK